MQKSGTWWAWLVRPRGFRSWRARRRMIAELKTLRAEVLEHPNDPRCLRQLGDALARAGEIKEAKSTFELCGRLHLKAAHAPRAVAMFVKAAELDRFDWRLRGLIGDLYVDADRRREAAAMFHEAAELAANQHALMEAEVFANRSEALVPRRPFTSVAPPPKPIVSDLVLDAEPNLVFEDPVFLPPPIPSTATELALDAESILLATSFNEAVTAACTPNEIESIRTRAFAPKGLEVRSPSQF